MLATPCSSLPRPGWTPPGPRACWRLASCSAANLPHPPQLTSRRGSRGRGVKTAVPAVGKCWQSQALACLPTLGSWLVGDIHRDGPDVTNCHLEAHGRRGGRPHTPAFPSLGIRQGFGPPGRRVGGSAPGQAGASSTAGPSGARPDRAAGGSSADVVPITEFGRVAWSLPTQVCGVRRVCRTGAARNCTAHGRQVPAFCVYF